MKPYEFGSWCLALAIAAVCILIVTGCLLKTAEGFMDFIDDRFGS